jgi:hypothetical protein
MPISHLRGLPPSHLSVQSHLCLVSLLRRLTRCRNRKDRVSSIPETHTICYSRINPQRRLRTTALRRIPLGRLHQRRHHIPQRPHTSASPIPNGTSSWMEI